MGVDNIFIAVLIGIAVIGVVLICSGWIVSGIILAVAPIALFFLVAVGLKY